MRYFLSFERSPLLLSFLCGLLSAAFSYSSLLISITPFFLAPLLLLSYLWLCPIFFVGLRHGPFYGGIAIFIVFSIHFILSGATPALILSISSLIPAFYLIFLLSSSQQSWGQIFSKICLLFLGNLISWLIFFGDVSSLKEQITSFLSSLLSSQTEEFSEIFIPFIPAIMVWSSLMSLFLNLFVCLKIIKKFFPNEEEGQRKNFLQIPPYWDIVFFSGLLLVLTGNEMFAFMGKNILLLSCVPLYLDGLGVVDYWLKAFENRGIWLSLAILFSLILGWPAMLIIFTALLKPVLQVTKRLK